LAFILILLGAFTLSVQKFGAHLFKIRKSFWWAMFASILYAFPPVLFKFIVVNASFWDTAAYEFVGGMIGTLILLVAYRKRFTTQLPLLSVKTWFVVIVNEGVYFGAQLCNLFAIALGPIALASAIISLNPFFVLVFGLILSIWFPAIVKEDISKSTLRTKIVAIALILLGVWLINR
jgi:drug/metabolite transporter (DMT)-like permease